MHRFRLGRCFLCLQILNSERMMDVVNRLNLDELDLKII
ncbi:MAG: hypothetical protein JWR12_2493 [Mucilaginibacter sp.]|nr:hypothetical protein [Mucilaginibacter sp.]